MYHIGFIIEQVLGHVTHGQNLKKNLTRDPSVAAYWGLPRPDTPHPIAKQINNWTVKAGLQSRESLRQMERETKLDALFFHSQVTAVLAQDWMRRIPSVVSLDATPSQYDSLGEFYDHKTGSGWAEKGKWWLNKRCFDQARHLVTWSAWAKQGLIDEYGIAPDKVTVIPPGVNSAEWMRPTPRQPHDGTVKILFVGGNLKRKGGDLLLEAYSSLRSANYPIELHLVTRDTVTEENGIHLYQGMQPNSPALKQLYYDCDIFCLPTYGDCLPMVLSEAGAAELPSISTRVAGIPELIKHGETGFIIPTGNVGALTEALRVLITQPEVRLQQGKRACELVSSQFDAQKNASHLVDLLKSVADGAV